MPTDDAPKPQPEFTGIRVLVVEDEAAIAMLMEDMLLDLGAETVGPAARLAEATARLHGPDAGAIDCAIIDVNVAGEAVYPFAEKLAALRIPFVFSTGYGAAGLEATWRDRPVLQKPFSQSDLEEALRAIGMPGAGRRGSA